MNDWDKLDAQFFGITADGKQQASGNPLDELDRRFKAGLASALQAKPKAEPITNFSGNLSFATPLGTIDTGLPLPEGVNRRLAQLGSGFDDLRAGITGLFASNKPKTTADLVTGQTEDSRARMAVDEKRKIDAQLNSDFSGKALNFAGKALPSLAIPFAAGAPVLSGIAAGGITGALEPVGAGESRGANAAVGAALGGALPAVVGGVRNMMRPNEATLDAARKASGMGIPLSPADISQNPFIRGLRAITNDLPIIGAPGAALKEQQQAAFNKAVGGTFGAAEAKLTPQVMDAAKTRMGAEFDRLWGQNTLQVDAPMFQQLQQLRQSAADLPPTQGARVIKQIDDFLAKAQPNANGSPVIPGEAANKFQIWLRETTPTGQSSVAHDFSAMRQSIFSAFERSVSPADAAALTANRAQYRAFKTVEPLLDKARLASGGREIGDVPAALLSEAVRGGYSGLSSQTAAPALADIAQVGSRFLVDRTPQTGGSPRALLQQIGIGAPLYAGIAHGLDGALAGGAGLAAGRGLNGLLNSPSAGASIIGAGAPRGLLGPSSMSAAAKEAALLGLYRSPLAASGLLYPLASPAFEQ